MQIIDLSHVIKPEMTVYPGTQPPVFSIGSTVEKDGYKETLISMFTHTGTHIDCPAHIFKHGTSIDNFPADKFYGSAVLINCSKTDNYINISQDMVQNEPEFVLLNTGWDKFWGTDKYFEGFPVLTNKSIDILLSISKLKGIAIDAISVDPVDSIKLETHNRLLSNNIVIIENLTNIEKITKTEFYFSCLPLKIENGDGSPVRAIAII